MKAIQILKPYFLQNKREHTKVHIEFVIHKSVKKVYISVAGDSLFAIGIMLLCKDNYQCDF